MIALDASGWSVGVDPALGGAILHARHDGRNVLRAAPAGCTDPLQAACFPLVPYANRIAGGRFDFAGRAYRVPRNFGDHPHSLHGVGWQSAWEVAENSAASVTLRLDHAGDARWPWPFVTEQVVTLSDAALEIRLGLTNSGDRAMPAGVGLHPYFPTRPDTRLRFSADVAWLSDATQLPTRRVAADHFGDWTIGATVARADLIDTAWDGWDGRAALVDADGETVVAATGASILHLYIPPGAGFLCVEPVSHLPDAINRDGMPVLESGARAELSMTITPGTALNHG